MISVGSLAVGYMLMNIFSKSSNLSGDVCSTLFGSTSILTLTRTEVLTCVILSVAVVVMFVLFYNRIFSVTFDESFAKATGTNAGLYNLLIAVIIAVIIVLAMNLVGSLLISALVIFPALSAMRVFKSFKSVTVCSAILSVCCASLGIIISIVAGTPVGSTIVVVDIIMFAIFTLTGKFSEVQNEKENSLHGPCPYPAVHATACGSKEEVKVGNQTLNNSQTVQELLDGAEDGASGETADDAPANTARCVTTKPYDGELDVDLTTLTSTMVYSEVYNMVTTPEDYEGKIVKMTARSPYTRPRSGITTPA
jgi:hypothetical protein